MHHLARVGFIGVWGLAVACISGDERKPGSTDTATLDTTVERDVACPDNCLEQVGVVAACQRAVWDEEACTCRVELLADDTPCDDQDACTVEDRCASGACQGQSIDVALACDDRDACTIDRCDPYDGCVHEADDGAACDDANACTLDEVCAGGACRWQTQYVCATCTAADPNACEAAYGDDDRCDGTLGCAAGFCEVDPSTVVDCRDPRLDPCVERHCDPATGACLTTQRDDGAACVDGSPCTADDHCKSGVCEGTPLAVDGCGCERDEDCAALDDGDLCDGTFYCDDRGTCRFDFGSIVVCDPSGDTACAVATCDPATGVCAPSPVHEGLACDDGDVCTTGDACAAGLCSGRARDCSDLDGTCVRGTCEGELGCVARPVTDGEPCDPHLRCVEAGLCDEGACVPRATACDDDDACTTDVCGADGDCIHAGPTRPSCKAIGACAAGVPVVCEGGTYRCAYEDLVGFGEVEVCDAVDNDCDGETDEGCVDASACAAGSTLAGAFGDGAMQSCQSGPDAPAACAAGWHVCSYTQMLGALGDVPPPSLYLIAASIAYDPIHGYRVEDRESGGCFEFQGMCSLGHEVQAVSWDGVFQGVVAYATEAWSCEGGVPTATCATADLAGALCCQNACADASDCADDSPCTVDTCDVARGRCVFTDKERPVCKTQGLCAGQGVVCGPLGTYVCGYESDPRYEAVETACDGLDNDCDGKTDALDPDLATAGPACEKVAGVCASAKKPASLCQDGRWLACTDLTYAAAAVAYEASGETRCDGLDNDCDGATDGGFRYAGLAVGADCDGVGACGPGKVVCAASGADATCSTNPDGPASGASNEDCNGLDDDCDGATDEPEDLDPTLARCSSNGVCRAGVPVECLAGASPGWRCDYDAVAEYHAVEHCDALDDDCDGFTDEDYELVRGDGPSLPIGSQCGSAGAACQGGRVVCAPDEASAICSSDVGASYELCDHVDNDCDGETDEGLTWVDDHGEHALGTPCDGRGACGPGTVECGGGATATCSTLPDGSASQATLERCNGADDDCDGAIDDGMVYNGGAVGAPCVGRGECLAGVVVCSESGSATCSTNPDGNASQATSERCNGKDDDCDGTTDDGVTVGPSDCTFAGVCTPQSGHFTCGGAAGWTCDFSQVPYYHAGNEVGLCDGRDNDCDGATDEDFAGLGAACDGDDADLCKKGTIACKADGTGTSCQGDVAAVEACNGVDDDCDGQTDEPNALGCTTYYRDEDHDGWGVASHTSCLCARGENAAQAGDCKDENPNVNPGRPELCNGVDDDCDGLTDAADAAELVVDDPRLCEIQLGVCAGTAKPAARCVNGAWAACVGADYLAHDARTQSVEQTCDGVDNDCDGKADANDPDLESQRPACAVQAGVCQGARTPLASCTAQGWSACTTAVYAANSPYYESGQELSCDGKDNDCDAATDEPFTFTGKAIGQGCDGTGACGLGVVQCRADKTAATCSTNPDGTASQAVAETCNGQDDDCDSATDEGLGVLQSTCRVTGVCNADNVQATCTQGAWLCSYANVPSYENGVELTCDGKDNDCDAATDEDFVLAQSGQTLHKGDVCGSGACLGSVICNAETSAPGDLVCSTATTTAEVCDGRDNDCDGQTDEDLYYRPSPNVSIAVGQPCDGVGQCGMGTVVCSVSQAPTCSTNPDGPAHQDVAESCNGLDDDCDGATDDGFSWGGLTIGKTCDGTGQCGLGVVECKADHLAATCSTQPDGSASQAVPETCNGKDDDCDSATDEALGILDSGCALTGVCNASNVSATCSGADGWKCDYGKVAGYHAGDELGYCDGLDNDCDGKTDEDYPELGKACDSDDEDLCAYGKWACPVANATPVLFAGTATPTCADDTASPERCNGLDDDCDGFVDEDNAVDCKLWFRDGDGDQWGDWSDARCLCGPDKEKGYTSQSSAPDCDDTLAFVHPGADEVCDELDDDCDEVVDEVGAVGCGLFYYDGDLDEHGLASDSLCLCEPWQGVASGHTADVGDDCNDGDSTVYPAAPERCDRQDNDCDNLVDEGADNIDCHVFYKDGDSDGYGGGDSRCLCAPDNTFRVTTPGDCCDADSKVRPNQSEFQTSPANSCPNPWDYNCSGTVEKSIPIRGACTCQGDLCGSCGFVAGWAIAAGTPIPGCGVTATYLEKCTSAVAICTAGTRNEKQGCR